MSGPALIGQNGADHHNQLSNPQMQSPHGELRVPTTVVIAGVTDTSNTVHNEGGVRYCLDPARIMFSSGNVNERMHFHNNVRATGEVVVDMFAGIGYFTLPLARSVHGPPAVIYALELNSDSAAYLVKGARVNKVSHIVSVIQCDNREPYISGCADRVLMGYIPTPVSFIDRALSFLRVDGGIVHYHYVAGKDDQHAMPVQHFAGRGYHVEVCHVRVVKVRDVARGAAVLFKHFSTVNRITRHICITAWPICTVYRRSFLFKPMGRSCLFKPMVSFFDITS